MINCTKGLLLVYVICALYYFILYRPACQCCFSIKEHLHEASHVDKGIKMREEEKIK